MKQTVLNRITPLAAIGVFLTLLGCSKADISPPPVAYTVTYKVYAATTYGSINYNTIPNQGSTADLYTSSYNQGSTWSLTLNATGYHNAPYYINAQCTSWGQSGWVYASVFQNSTLVQLDSAYGSVNTQLILQGNLPK